MASEAGTRKRKAREMAGTGEAAAPAARRAARGEGASEGEDDGAGMLEQHLPLAGAVFALQAVARRSTLPPGMGAEHLCFKLSGNRDEYGKAATFPYRVIICDSSLAGAKGKTLTARLRAAVEGQASLRGRRAIGRSWRSRAPTVQRAWS